MTKITFEEDLQCNIEASAPIIQIISHETLRIRAMCDKSSKQLKRHFLRWNSIDGLTGLKNGDGQQEIESLQPHEIFEWIHDADKQKNYTGKDDNGNEGWILLLEDFHHNLIDSEYKIITRLRNFAIAVAGRKLVNRTIILSQPLLRLPIELEKECQVMELPLPGLEDLKKIMRQISERYNLDEKDYFESSSLLEAALGLSTSEAQLAFSRAASQNGRLKESEIPIIVAQKEQVIRKSGTLEYFHPESTLDDIGGLDQLKSWLKRRKEAFTNSARNYGLEIPRGIMLLGLPGTGKSLAAKAVANAWQLPLLRLDMGKIYGGIVGQSEENMRSALQTAEALAPSILWIDEIEKGMSGIQSSGSTDGGTTARVLGNFLTWMQEKEKPVFVVATANNISQLPPELLRKGRVDEIFFVDLPVKKDRKEILEIHLKKRNRDKDLVDQELDELAKLSKGFTGAELEESIKEAMFLAYDEGRQLSKADIEKAINTTSPLSKTMSEIIKKTRQWANGRAVPASSAQPEPVESSSDKPPRLKNEEENPFL